MFNTCSYKVRYGDRLREAEQLQSLGEFKNFPRERPEKLGSQKARAASGSSLRRLRRRQWPQRASTIFKKIGINMNRNE
jgi:hypothetical protein